MKVLKFGGTSMGSADAMRAIQGIINQNINDGNKILLACSAVSGITNSLIELGELAYLSKYDDALILFQTIKTKHLKISMELGVLDVFEKETATLFLDLRDLLRGIVLIKEISPRSKAYLLSFGERLSTRLLSIYLQSKGIQAEQYDADFIRTKGKDFEEDEINWESTIPLVQNTLLTKVKEGIIPIVTGFWGRNSNNVITLLGRGGSDFSGAILAVSLNISVLEIWTDVNGFLSADPRIVENAKIIDEIGFQEASELCFFGAKVLHPKTIRPVIDNDGEVWIKNTFAPNIKGSKITKHAQASYQPVVSISSKKVEMISLDLFATSKVKSLVLDEVFRLAHHKEIHLDMLALSEAQLSFCIENNQPELLDFLTDLKEVCTFEHKGNRSIVCIVSPKEVKGQIGVAGKIFGSIAESKVSIDMYSQNASEIAQLIVVNRSETEKVIQHIHKNLVVGSERIQNKIDV